MIARSFPDIEFDVPDQQPVVQEASEQRTGRRHPLIWLGELHHDYQSTQVRIRNISPTGAMIECKAMLHAGSEPLLDLGNSGSMFATVMWAVGDHAGLRFNQPFDLAQLARSRPEVAPDRWTGPNFINPQEQGDSPWAEQWGRMSVGELKRELEGYLKH